MRRTASSISTALKEEAREWPGLDRHGPGADGDHRPELSPGTRRRGSGARAMAGRRTPSSTSSPSTTASSATSCGCWPAPAARSRWCRRRRSAEDILAHKPDGVFLSNGPGDPAATGEYAVPVIQKLIDTGMPMFGICLGHQMLGLALGGKTMKMHQGHHGANHPVKDLTTGKVEITSMNHGFAVDRDDAAGRRRGDPRLAVRRLELRHRARRTSRCSRCSITPRPRPARATATICSSASSR